MLDSGTTFTYMPSPVFRAFASGKQAMFYMQQLAASAAVATLPVVVTTMLPTSHNFSPPCSR